MNGDFPQSKAILYTNDVMYSLATKGIIFLDNHRCFPFLGLVSRIPNFTPHEDRAIPCLERSRLDGEGVFSSCCPRTWSSWSFQTERTRETRLA